MCNFWITDYNDSSLIFDVSLFQLSENPNAFLNRMLNRDTITRINYKRKTLPQTGQVTVAVT